MESDIRKIIETFGIYLENKKRGAELLKVGGKKWRCKLISSGFARIIALLFERVLSFVTNGELQSQIEALLASERVYLKLCFY